MQVTYSGRLATAPSKHAPLLVIKGGELIFEFHPDPMVMRKRIEDFHRDLRALPEARTDGFDVQHEYRDGMYIRKLRIPKGDVLVGKIHRKSCVNFLESGDLSVVTETGMARIKPGFNVVSPPGLQKVGIAHEESVFVNVFRTELNPDVLGWDEFLRKAEVEMTAEIRDEQVAFGGHEVKGIEL